MKPKQTTQEAIESVKQGNISYYQKALSFALEWCKIQMKPFTSEELKNAFYALGNNPPAEARIFGAVIVEVRKAGIIFPNGYKKSENPICHSRPKTLWISLSYRLKQQKNATKEQSLKLEL